MILGLIGFLGNAFTFLQSTLRSNTFCIYSLCGSLIDIINLVFKFIIAYYSASFNLQYARITSSIICKMFCHAQLFLPQLSINFTVLSLIDRFACTCSLTSSIRRLNQLKMAPRWIIITVIVSFLIPMHAIIINDVVVGRGCTSTQPLIYGILSTFISGLMQPLTMLIFVLLTYRNIQKSRQRVGGTIITNGNLRRNQFLSMIILQILGTACLSLPAIIVYAFSLVSPSSNRNAEQNVIVYFIYNLTNYLYYLNNVKSFYVATLASRLFRQTFITSLKKLISRIICREQL